MPTDMLDPGMTDTVLLVENERDIASHLGRMLEREGYDVAWVGNGRDVLDVVDGGPVDCVILDASAPRHGRAGAVPDAPRERVRRRHRDGHRQGG